MRLGIVAQDKEGMVGVDDRYMMFGNLFGEVNIISPDTQPEFMQALDGIILPGGSDVDSRRYGQKPAAFTQKPNTFLEYFDAENLPNLIGKVPLIGICRGIQTINVALGGTLNQHIYWHSYSKEDDDLVHDVQDSSTGEKFGTNSFHHQAIELVAPSLTVLATVGKGKHSFVEAVGSEELRIFAVQWHPERCMDEWSITKICNLLGIPERTIK